MCGLRSSVRFRPRARGVDLTQSDQLGHRLVTEHARLLAAAPALTQSLADALAIA
jgi:hypothetical protein